MKKGIKAFANKSIQKKAIKIKGGDGGGGGMSKYSNITIKRG